MLNETELSHNHITAYFQKATKWVNLFTSLGGQCEGYTKAKVTPYIHGMAYHVPRFMKTHDGIKKFTGQGVEKNNDDCRRIHLQKSNKWDAAKDVLLVSKRLEALDSFDRTPRVYLKRNSDYWETDIKEKRAKKRESTDSGFEDSREILEDEHIDQMSAYELKKALKEIGITTRVRSLKRLQELYRGALMDV